MAETEARISAYELENKDSIAANEARMVRYDNERLYDMLNTSMLGQ